MTTRARARTSHFDDVIHKMKAGNTEGMLKSYYMARNAVGNAEAKSFLVNTVGAITPSELDKLDNKTKEELFYVILTSVPADGDMNEPVTKSPGKMKKVIRGMKALVDNIPDGYLYLEDAMANHAEINAAFTNTVRPVQRGHAETNRECKQLIRMCDESGKVKESMRWWVEEYMRLYRTHDVVSAAFLVSCLIIEDYDLETLLRKKNIRDLRGGSVRRVKYDGPMRGLNLSGGLDARREIYLDRVGFLSNMTRNMRKVNRIDSQQVILPMFLLAFGRESGSCIDNAILKYRDDLSDVFLETSHFQCITTSCPLRRSTQVSTYPTWSPLQCKDHIRVEAGPKAFLLLTFSSMIRHLSYRKKRIKVCSLFNSVLPLLCPDVRDQVFMKHITVGRCKPPSK